MADRSIYAPPARLFAGDIWAWEIADPARLSLGRRIS